MFKKVYEKIKKIIINNHNFILFVIFIAIVLNIKVPYVISAPGGVLPLNNRIEIDGKKIDTNFYTTYVRVYNGNVASFILGKVMPKWDVEKIDKYSGSNNLSYEDVNMQEVLLMKRSNSIASSLALKEAGIPYEEVNNKLYVLYKMEGYDNDLKIGDQIISCDKNSTKVFEDLYSCIYNSKNNNIDLVVKRNNKNISLNTKLYNHQGNRVIGINVYQDFTVKSDPSIKVTYAKNESGSSGGLMTALSIYDSLTNLNISKKYKIAGTGTIDEEGKVGEIGGIKYKLLGSSKSKVDVFFCPKDNYKEALKIKKKYKLKINIVEVDTFTDAVNYLKKLK